MPNNDWTMSSFDFNCDFLFALICYHILNRIVRKSKQLIFQNGMLDMRTLKNKNEIACIKTLYIHIGFDAFLTRGR